MKFLLFSALFLCLSGFSQEFGIYDLPDTVHVNSNVPCWGTTVKFSNNTQNFVTTAVIDTASQQLAGTTQVVGFNGCNTPLPGQPDILGVEGYDTLFAMFTYFPNGQVGTTVVDVCFFNWNNPGDTICETIVIITDPFASQDELTTNGLLIFPNPSQGQFNITGLENVSENAVLCVYNNAGQLIYTAKVEDTVELEGLRAGNYNMIIEDGNFYYIGSFIINK